MEEFPGDLVVRILGFHCCGLGSTPGGGTEIPQAILCGRKKKRRCSIKVSVSSFPLSTLNMFTLGLKMCLFFF